MIRDLARLQRTLGTPGLARLVARLRTRLERGEPLEGRLSLPAPTQDERSAIDGLLGRRSSGRDSISVDLQRLDEALRAAELCDGLGEAVEALTGAVMNRRAQRAEHTAAWETLFDEARARLDQRVELLPWLDDLRGSGWLRRVTGSEPEPARRLLLQALDVLERLPAAEPVGLSELAAAVAGDAHALDPDTLLSTLVLRSSTTIADVESWENALERRDAWAKLGVVVDEVSGPALLLNLRARDEGLTSRLLRLHADEGEPCRLTVRLLLRHPPVFSPEVTGTHVFVCENPTVLATAARRLGRRSAPLVCTDGQPSTAVRVLLERLREGGVELLFHADFDWDGLRIGSLLVRRHAAIPWRFSALDYVTRRPRGPHLGARRVRPEWDPSLDAALCKASSALHEEGVLDDLLRDLEGLTCGERRSRRLDDREIVASHGCPRRTWCDSSAPQDGDVEAPDAWHARLRASVWREAGRAFPGYRVRARDRADAIDETTCALGSGVTSIHGAVVEHGGVVAHVHLMSRPAADAPWRLIRVTHATEVQDAHLAALAVQMWVLRAGGVPLAGCSVLHVNSEHVVGGSDPLTLTDVTANVLARSFAVPSRVEALRDLLSLPEAPSVEIGPHCGRRSARPCAFLHRCWPADAAPTPLDLPRAGPAEWSLFYGGARTLDAVPAEALSERQRIHARCLLDRARHVDVDVIASRLQTWQRPLAFLDFEAVGLAVPRYTGTRPYEPVPFQFSLQFVEAAGPRHEAYLHADADDPRPAVAARLVQALRGHVGAVVVYNQTFERTCLRSLAAQCPDLAADLDRVADRLVDLERLIEDAIFDPAFAGSFSLKSVAPVLLCVDAPKNKVSTGLEAQEAFEAYQEASDPSVRSSLRDSLLEYCERDTRLMVELVQWLQGLVST